MPDLREKKPIDYKVMHEGNHGADSSPDTDEFNDNPLATQDGACATLNDVDDEALEDQVRQMEDELRRLSLREKTARLKLQIRNKVQSIEQLEIETRAKQLESRPRDFIVGRTQPTLRI